MACFPLVSGQFGCFVGSACVAVYAVVLASERECHIHPQRRRVLVAKRFLFFDFQKGDGVDFLGLRQRADGVDEFLVVSFSFLGV